MVLHPGPTYYLAERPLSEKPADLEVCGGDLRVDVQVFDQPEWGYSYAKLEVKITCLKCGSTFHGHPSPIPETPQDLSKLLTMLLEDM